MAARVLDARGLALAAAVAFAAANSTLRAAIYLVAVAAAAASVSCCSYYYWYWGDVYVEASCLSCCCCYWCFSCCCFCYCCCSLLLGMCRHPLMVSSEICSVTIYIFSMFVLRSCFDITASCLREGVKWLFVFLRYCCGSRGVRKLCFRANFVVLYSPSFSPTAGFLVSSSAFADRMLYLI